MAAKRTTRGTKATGRAKPKGKGADLSHIAPALHALAVPLDTLIQDPANARTHNPKNIDAIAASLRVFGQRKPVVVNRQTDIVEAGNGTLEAARSLGWTHIAAVSVDDDPATAAGFAIADNRTAELAEWDTEALARQLGEITPGDDERLDQMLADLASAHGLSRSGTNGVAAAGEAPAPRLDQAAQLQAHWGTATDQVWLIASKSQPGGVHRLLCGDSTKPWDVARLMAGQKASLVVADPPYGVDFQRGQYITDKSRVAKTIVPDSIEGDYRKSEKQGEFIQEAFTVAQPHCVPGASVYMFSAPLAEGSHSMLGLAKAGVHIQSQLVWVKNNHVLGIADYHWKHEICWYGWYEGAAHRWYGGRDKFTVLEFNRLSSTLHPNEKPADLIVFLITNSSKPAELVYDPFCGAGTVIVAAENAKRIGHGVELTPAFVAVALQRLADMGLEPRLAS